MRRARLAPVVVDDVDERGGAVQVAH